MWENDCVVLLIHVAYRLSYTLWAVAMADWYDGSYPQTLRANWRQLAAQRIDPKAILQQLEEGSAAATPELRAAVLLLRQQNTRGRLLQIAESTRPTTWPPTQVSKHQLTIPWRRRRF